MSLGATASAPASAWEIATRASSSSVCVVVDLAVAADHAAVAVVGVLAEADVGDHGQAGHLRLDRGDGLLHGAVGAPGAAALSVLVVGQAEQQHRGHAQFMKGARLFDGAVDGHAADAGHRLDRLAARLAEQHEERLDQVLGRKAGLAHEVADAA